jgi:hypothetical protein
MAWVSGGKLPTSGMLVITKLYNEVCLIYWNDKVLKTYDIQFVTPLYKLVTAS